MNVSGHDVLPPTESGGTAFGPKTSEAEYLLDSYGRRVEYIRLSLTDRCNFRCVYCMPQQGLPFIPHSRILRYEDLSRLCRNFAALGISRYKITGGEPLCRKGATDFIKDLSRLPGVDEITLTTNGSLVEQNLVSLREANVRTITFSFDSLDPDAFEHITRSGSSPAAIMKAMEAAAAAGLQVKINVVPLKGLNEEQLAPLAHFALERGYHIRFIELMPLGNAGSYSGVSRDELAGLMEKKFGPLRRLDQKTGNGPAEMFSVDGQPGCLGFIAALSHNFCHTCNRVRLTSTGYLKTCLYHETGVNLQPLLQRGASDAELQAHIRKAVDSKPKGHHFSSAIGPGGSAPPRGPAFFMNTVGG